MNDQLLYFAHVPKCAGTSVSDYLAARFGRPAFEDRLYFAKPEILKWNRTSPQHIPAAHLARLVPEGFIDHSVAMVRHPETRIRSVFLFQKYCERRIPRYVPFRVWLQFLVPLHRASPFVLDNHLSSASALLPKGTTVFRLEDGFEGFVKHIDFLASNSVSTPINVSNVGPMPGRDLSDGERALIYDAYREDYEAFGYLRDGRVEPRPVE